MAEIKYSPRPADIKKPFEQLRATETAEVQRQKGEIMSLGAVMINGAAHERLTPIYTSGKSLAEQRKLIQADGFTNLLDTLDYFSDERPADQGGRSDGPLNGTEGIDLASSETSVGYPHMKRDSVLNPGTTETFIILRAVEGKGNKVNCRIQILDASGNPTGSQTDAEIPRSQLVGAIIVSEKTAIVDGLPPAQKDAAEQFIAAADASLMQEDFQPPTDIDSIIETAAEAGSGVSVRSLTAFAEAFAGQGVDVPALMASSFGDKKIADAQGLTDFIQGLGVTPDKLAQRATESQQKATRLQTRINTQPVGSTFDEGSGPVQVTDAMVQSWQTEQAQLQQQALELQHAADDLKNNNNQNVISEYFMLLQNGQIPTTKGQEFANGLAAAARDKKLDPMIDTLFKYKSEQAKSDEERKQLEEKRDQMKKRITEYVAGGMGAAGGILLLFIIQALKEGADDMKRMK